MKGETLHSVASPLHLHLYDVQSYVNVRSKVRKDHFVLKGEAKAPIRALDVCVTDFQYRNTAFRTVVRVLYRT